jgi:hypothetical protein
MKSSVPVRRTTRMVDPLEYLPKAESRIAGLGGQAIPAEPSYAFHSGYAEIGAGIVSCTFRFERLEATMGLLTIRVNGLAPGPESRAETIRTWTADLRDVAESDGVLEISFQASEGSSYAFLGHIYEETDARARGLTLELQLTPDAPAAGAQHAVRKSLFGRRVFRRTAKMVVRARPTLADPVSQPCTRAQLAEPVFQHWTQAMRIGDAPDPLAWGEVYVLQALERYGMLRPGARGVGLALGPSRLPAVMAARGCSVVATVTTDETGPRRRRSGAANVLLEQLRHPEICADDVFDRQVTSALINLDQMGGKLNGFDFAWSLNIIEEMDSPDAGLLMVREAMRCLTFGGLAVHVTLFNTRSHIDTVANDAIVLPRSQDLERIAVDLVSRGHYVAQLGYDLGDPPVDPVPGSVLAPEDADLAAALDGYAPVPFGLIVRRGER